MSSILDALRKLEEEKTRQFHIIEFDVEETESLFAEDNNEAEFTEPSSIVSFETTPHVTKKAPFSSTLSSKLLITVLIGFSFVLIILSCAISYIVVKTQVPFHKSSENLIAQAEDTPTLSHPTSSGSLIQNNVEPSTSLQQEQKNTIEIVSPQELPAKSSSIEFKQDKVEETSPNIQEKPEDKPISLAKKVTEPTTKIKKEVGKNPISTQYLENREKQNSMNIEIEERKPTLMITDITEKNIITNGENKENESKQIERNSKDTSQNANEYVQPQHTSTVSQPIENPIQVPPLVARDLASPPSLQMDQFRQKILPNTKNNEPVNIHTLPVIKTSDKIRLGLDKLQMNVLREANPKNPYGLAIINLNKIYVGEIIPGTSVRLIEVKTHGIAVEVLGTGERFYIPR